MIEAAFAAKALGTAGITSLIGTSPARIYPNAIPQTATLPAATYQLVSDVREECMVANAGVRHARIQVTAVASTYLAARTIADAFAAAFNRWSGTSASTVVQQCWIENAAGNLDQNVGLEAGAGIALATLDLLFDYEG